MKQKCAVFALVLFLLVSALASAETVGKKLPAKGKYTTISSIHKDPKKFIGKTVLVSGKLQEQCPMASVGHGCWLSVTDKGGKFIVIEFEGNKLFYRQAYPEGTTVKVQGVVKTKGNEFTARSNPVKKGQIYILATGAEIGK